MALYIQTNSDEFPILKPNNIFVDSTIAIIRGIWIGIRSNGIKTSLIVLNAVMIEKVVPTEHIPIVPRPKISNIS